MEERIKQRLEKRRRKARKKKEEAKAEKAREEVRRKQAREEEEKRIQEEESRAEEKLVNELSRADVKPGERFTIDTAQIREMCETNVVEWRKKKKLKADEVVKMSKKATQLQRQFKEKDFELKMVNMNVPRDANPAPATAEAQKKLRDALGALSRQFEEELQATVRAVESDLERFKRDMHNLVQQQHIKIVSGGGSMPVVNPALGPAGPGTSSGGGPPRKLGAPPMDPARRQGFQPTAGAPPAAAVLRPPVPTTMMFGIPGARLGGMAPPPPAGPAAAKKSKGGPGMRKLQITLPGMLG